MGRIPENAAVSPEAAAARTLIDAAVEHLPQAQMVELPYPHARLITDPANAVTRIEDLERYADAPRRVRARVTHETPASFAAYVNDFREAGARLFASLDARAVVARLDWHVAGGEAGAATPSWATHEAVYPAVFSEPFEAWFEAQGKPMGQRAFAEFLEDRAEDAVAPEPADLMEVAQKFEAVRDVQFRSAVNLHSGERQFQYEEKDRAGGLIACPRVIRLRAPVFRGCDPVEFGVRLAYSIGEGRLAFTVRIHRCAELLDAEFERLVDAIAVACPAVPFHRGRA